MDWLIMDWLILILLVPAIIVPIVLLWGFAGCASFSAADPVKTPAPTNLKATAKGPNLITLQWDDNSGGTAKFKYTRQEEGLTPPPPKTKDLPTNPFDDTEDLKEGITYFYTVTAGSQGKTDSDASDGARATAFPATPSNLTATPQEVNRIDLSWTNNSNQANQFIIQDKLIPAGSIPETKVPKGASQPFPVPVPEGSAHEFQVLAVMVGFQENVLKLEVRSLPSAPRTAKPLAFKATLTGDDPDDRRGYCLVQRISSTLLKNKGTQVKITVRGSTTSDLSIEKIYISQPHPSSTMQPWDPYTDLTKILDVSPPGLQLLPNTPWTSSFIAYSLDQTKDLLIAFDISGLPDQGNLRSAALTGATAYLRASTKQAADQDRGGGYNTEQGKLYLVEKIEVL